MGIRRSYDRLIVTMGFPILVRCHLYIESGPRTSWKNIHMILLCLASFWLLTNILGLLHWQSYGCSKRVRLRWCHNRRDGVSFHQPYDCLLKSLFRRGWKKTSKLRVTGLCVGNSPVTGEFPAQMTSNAENVSIWWRHHAVILLDMTIFGRTTMFEPHSWFLDVICPRLCT